MRNILILGKCIEIGIIMAPNLKKLTTFYSSKYCRATWHSSVNVIIYIYIYISTKSVAPDRIMTMVLGSFPKSLQLCFHAVCTIPFNCNYQRTPTTTSVLEYR